MIGGKSYESGSHHGNTERQCCDGEEVHYFKGAELCSVITTEDIPPCHKIAVAPIAKGAHIIKYGEIIGGAQVDIPVGSWVSHLNIESLPRDYGSELSK